MKLATLLRGCTAAAALGVVALSPAQAAHAKQEFPFRHIVIIYEENHSFDNLYGLWDQVEGQSVNGLANADSAHTTQVRQDNTTPYGCLYQLDVNLTSPPLPATCTDNAGSVPITSHFTNGTFAIDDYIPPIAETCPTPNQFATNGILNGQGLPGGCTRDIFHRFYSEQYQFDGGKQDRYMTGSDASGLTMGHFNTKQLPIYTFLHSAGAPHYVVMDNFFQGAFGGSFLNHQWLVSAAAPAFANAAHDGGSTDLHSIVDTNGMPTATPLYAPTTTVKDSQLTVECTAPKGHHYSPNLACGDFAVNTTQPTYQPFSPGTAGFKQLPPLTSANIGDEMSAANVSWAWFSGGWSNADGDVGKPGWTNGTYTDHSCTDPNVLASAVWPNCPDGAFQFHHQPFNYYASYAPGTKARKEHLLDEAQFFEEANSGTLPKVSFIKPVGEENEHPGYASEAKGSSHLVNLLNAVFNGRDGKNTLVIVTYDEFGGQWDHVPPPGQAGGPSGPSDQWGPGTRIAAIAIAPKFRHSGVDHAEHDTTSLLATIEHQYGLAPMGTRDAAVSDLKSAVKIGLHGVKQ
ncbi:MAG TPA: alkaline phosphatase family protein [Rhizomicrobium sp.]|jgi:phospholipase C|nr:alkaline phosphatase family protein [Rhizomicrobium sp.]